MRALPVALFVCAAFALAKPPSAGQRFVEEFLAKAKANDWKYDAATWPKIAAEARRRAADTTDALSAYPIVADVLWQMGDEHGALDPGEKHTEEYKARYGKLWSEPRSHRPASALMDRAEVVVSDVAVGARSARVVILPHLFQNQDEPAYARKVLDAIAGANACGFVIDLRGNVGGDMWPMLVAVAPLLGTESPGAFTSRTEGLDRWFVRGGRSGGRHANGKVETAFTLAGWRAPPAGLAELPVALLLDDGTLSAGEAVAVAFAGRPGARSFGKKTYGLSTANTPFPLGDGVRVWMAVGVYQDRAGKNYPDGVAPDVEVDAAIDAAAGRDPALDAARAWLASQPACR